MTYNGKLFLALSASVLAGAAIGYLLSSEEKSEIAKKLAEKLIVEKKKSFGEAVSHLKNKLHTEAEQLADEVENIAKQMI